ncbi:STAS domain-containing protein [Azospirillum sp. YIM B02556]|uniref:Anti-sigma factor antagonist n=2 Tax=Azospirillum endophyticum TaxID=2800326 RepID=A0ABS1FCG7_9PROT|nr:STAS domain-containing protein [Azospirillum endophyticum]
MDFQATDTGDTTEVRLMGRLEFTDHDRLRDIVGLVERSDMARFVIDLSALEFIDSAGLGMLLILQEETETRNVRMIVQGAAGDVKRSIDLARLGEIITIAS